jgi:hypothetical protein
MNNSPKFKQPAQDTPDHLPHGVEEGGAEACSSAQIEAQLENCNPTLGNSVSDDSRWGPNAQNLELNALTGK